MCNRTTSIKRITDVKKQELSWQEMLNSAVSELNKKSEKKTN